MNVKKSRTVEDAAVEELKEIKKQLKRIADLIEEDMYGDEDEDEEDDDDDD